MVDSFGIPVGFVEDKNLLSITMKCSKKVEVFTNRAVSIYFLCRDVIIEIRFFFLYDTCGDISTMVIDINCCIGENLDITFIYLSMLNICQ